MVPLMNEDKQLLYYSRLAVLGVNKAIFIRLNEVAEVLFTSSRHCRTLLKEMHELGWLEWTPKAGRNQRSRLYLSQTLDELKIELAKQMIANGRYEKALGLINNDQLLFGQLLHSTSGSQRRAGRLHIQLTYDRPFSALLPHKPHRNSERFFLRQIYSCLTQCTENGELLPQLAHHWSYNEAELSWRFYLRPQLTFHDGTEIDALAIVSLYRGLQTQDIYRIELDHVASITAVNPLCVEFQLKEPDLGFAGMIADIKYSIQPPHQLTQRAKQNIVGSGSFQVQEHTEQGLKLHAFNNYHGYRALTDSVTIWQVEKLTRNSFGDTGLQADLLSSSGSACSNYLSVETDYDREPIAPNSGERGRFDKTDSDLQSRIEDGGLFTLINSQSPLDHLQRKYLAKLLATESLMEEVTNCHYQIEAVKAYNLLPFWSKTILVDAREQPLPAKLIIALYDHQALKACALSIQNILSKKGVDVQVTIYSFEEFYRKSQGRELHEDLILTSLNLDDNRPTSAFRWMYSDPVLHQSLSLDGSQWLREELNRIRKTKPLQHYLAELEPIATAMITEHWVLPMFHHRQTLHFEGVLKGVSLSVWGWPVIQDVWSED